MKKDPREPVQESTPDDFDFDLMDPWFGVEIPKPPGSEETPKDRKPQGTYPGASANQVKSLVHTPFLPTEEARTTLGIYDGEEEANPFDLGPRGIGPTPQPSGSSPLAYQGPPRMSRDG